MPSSYAPTLLPPPLRQDLSLRSLETLSARTAALDLSALVLYDYQHVPAQALRTLAEQLNLLGDAGWDFAGFCTAPEARQRALLKEAVALHRLKGTRYALQRALDLMGLKSRLTEWWQTEPPAQPHTFVVDLLLTDSDSGPLSPERADALLRLVHFWKPARSRFRARVAVELARHERMAGVLRPAATLRADLRVHSRHQARLQPRSAAVLRPAATLQADLHVQSRHRVQIQPRSAAVLRPAGVLRAELHIQSRHRAQIQRRSAALLRPAATLQADLRVQSRHQAQIDRRRTELRMQSRHQAQIQRRSAALLRPAQRFALTILPLRSTS